MTELEKFQEDNPDLDIRVFGGIIPKGEWSFGFKALIAKIATMVIIVKIRLDPMLGLHARIPC